MWNERLKKCCEGHRRPIFYDLPCMLITFQNIFSALLKRRTFKCVNSVHFAYHNLLYKSSLPLAVDIVTAWTRHIHNEDAGTLISWKHCVSWFQSKTSLNSVTSYQSFSENWEAHQSALQSRSRWTFVTQSTSTRHSTERCRQLAAENKHKQTKKYKTAHP